MSKPKTEGRKAFDIPILNVLGDKPSQENDTQEVRRPVKRRPSRQVEMPTTKPEEEYLLPSGKKTQLTLKYVSPQETTVHPLNARLQDRLNEEAVSDILPSIRQNGIQQPLLARQKGDQVEIIWGSRRRYAAILAERPLPCLVGEIDESDAILLASSSNSYKKESPYEIGLAIDAILKDKDNPFPDVVAVGEAFGLSKAKTHRCLNIARLPSSVISAIENPLLIPIMDGDEFARAWKKTTPEEKEAMIEAIRKVSLADDLDEEAAQAVVTRKIRQAIKVLQNKERTPPEVDKTPLCYADGTQALVIEKKGDNRTIKIDKSVTEAEWQDLEKTLQDWTRRLRG